MNLCSDDHDEVCFEGRKCPACDLKKQVDDCESEITDLKSKIEQLEQNKTE